MRHKDKRKLSGSGQEKDKHSSGVIENAGLS
jgi:hypothetical protein